MLNPFIAFLESRLRTLPGVYGITRRVCNLKRPLIPDDIYASDKKLNLGCGKVHLPGYLNVDGLAEQNPDVVARGG